MAKIVTNSVIQNNLSIEELQQKFPVVKSAKKKTRRKTVRLNSIKLFFLFLAVAQNDHKYHSHYTAAGVHHHIGHRVHKAEITVLAAVF